MNLVVNVKTGHGELCQYFLMMVFIDISVELRIFLKITNSRKRQETHGVTIIKNIGFTREGYKNHHYIGVIELFPT